MKSSWIKGFTTTQKVFKGQLGLVLLCVLLIIIWRVQIHYFQQQPSEHSVSQQADSLYNTWLQAQENVPTTIESKQQSYAENATAVPKPLQAFDPNTATIAEMEASGVPIRLAKNIFNYRDKGGAYRKASDLKKLYAMNDSLFSLLAPFIQINSASLASDNKASSFPAYEDKSTGYTPKGYFKFNINTADKNILMQLKGIGQGYAQRIIDRRAALGGYYAPEQLKEIYGFPDSTYEALLPYVVIEVKDIVGIDFNNAPEESLAAHPYIGKRMAKDIVKVRQDLGGFKQINDLRNIPLLNEEKYRKIAKYFKNP